MDKKDINYFKIYDFLYKIGYHGKGQNHGAKYIDKLCRMFDFDTILDIGCSQGITVGKFLKRRKLAYGIDVSLNAIRMATGKKYNIPNCIQASATNIPFVDNFVDAVFTCDVLEHLTEEDVQKAIDEINRITKRYIFIIFDDAIEGNRSWIEKGKEMYPIIFDKIPNLHLTIKTISWWKKEIEKRGFKLKKKVYLNGFPQLHCYERIGENK